VLSYGCVIQRYRRWVRRKAATEDDGRGVVAALVVRVLNCRDFIGHEVHTDVEVCAIPAEDHDAIRPDFDGHARAGEVIGSRRFPTLHRTQIRLHGAKNGGGILDDQPRVIKPVEWG